MTTIRKIYYDFKVMTMLLGLLLFFFSCSRVDNKETTPQKVTIRGLLEQAPDTKTALGIKTLNNIPLLWSAGDKIALFCGTNTTLRKFDLMAGENTKIGLFEGFMNREERGASDALYAFYPYSDKVTISHSPTTITFTLPTEQIYKADNIQNGANPTVAYAAPGATEFQFKNLCGILRLKITGSTTTTIKKIIVCANNGYLSGKFTVDPTVATPTMTRVPGSASNMVILNLENGVLLSGTPKQFHIVVPPHTMTSTDSLMVWVESSSGAMEKITKTNSISQGNVLSMTQFNYVDDSNLPVLYIENGVYKGKGIKVTGLTIGTSPILTNQTRIFAPVNCGYEPVDGTYKGYPYGKYYQWGRKYGEGLIATVNNISDGSGYDDATTADTTSGPVSSSIGFDIINRSKFYKFNGDWCSGDNTINRKFWNSAYPEDNNPVKVEANDPCPPGWRVPSWREIEGLRNKGTTWTPTGYHGSTGPLSGKHINSFTKLFFPTSGYRAGADGKLNKRNLEGWYWVSGVASNFSYRWGFSSSVDNNIGVIRAHACPVRCVKQ